MSKYGIAIDFFPWIHVIYNSLEKCSGQNELQPNEECLRNSRINDEEMLKKIHNNWLFSMIVYRIGWEQIFFLFGFFPSFSGR